jgi:UDPglucose 6-dehydrogenase
LDEHPSCNQRQSKQVPQPLKIHIVGSGVVGTATGSGFLGLGHEVTFVDTSQERVELLRSAGFVATNELLLGHESAVIFVAVPTPADPVRGHDLSMMRLAVEHVGCSLADSNGRHTIAVRSTVLPGTLDKVVTKGLERASGKRAHIDFGVASAPEFLRAVSAANDVVNPWMTVLASRDQQTLSQLSDLFAPFGGELRTFSNPVYAELIKVIHNVFNATKISFWNEMWLICQSLGIDANLVAETVARSAEGSINPEYGIKGGYAYGGACLPKEVCALIAFARSIKIDAPLIESVSAVNDSVASLETVLTGVDSVDEMA